MERFTISLENNLARQFDEFIKGKAYSNRSEAVRDLIRSQLETKRLAESDEGFCIATLTYVYNHHEFELASRITSTHHEHHDLTLASTHVHLDHDNCLEVVILRGATKNVRKFADAIIASRGVRHGKVVMVPVEVREEGHRPGHHPHTHHNPIT